MKKTLFTIFLIFLFSNFIFSQFPYHGKNKIITKRFDWKSYQTEHFEIYFYGAERERLELVAGIAEDSYKKLQALLLHDIKEKTPLIVYDNQRDFQQTNLYPGILPEGVLAFAEPILHRIVLPTNIPDEELYNLITHELTHIFEYSILYGDIKGGTYNIKEPPLWIMEGLAEYSTGEWSPISLMIVRDATLNDTIPELDESGEFRSSYSRAPYDFGHAIFDFVDAKYGKSGIRQILWEAKKASIFAKNIPFKETFKMGKKEFNYEFKKFMRERFKEFLTKENPEDYSVKIGPELPFAYDISHELSPSGEIVAILTANMKDEDIDILLLSVKDGSIIKNLTPGYTSRYEFISANFDPSYGKDISWDSKGENLAFFANKGHKTYLFTISAIDGKETFKVEIPYVQPSSPVFSPDGKEILFTAYHEGKWDIFSVELESKKFKRLTNDKLREKSLALSSDGKWIAFSVVVNGKDKIFIAETEDLSSRRQITFTDGNDITPFFSKDGNTLYFCSDEKGAFNIYAIDLKENKLKRYTDVRTGNFFPNPLPDSPDTLFFSSFHKGYFNLYRKQFKEPLEVRENLPKEGVSKEGVEESKVEGVVSSKWRLAVDEKKIKQHKGIGKLFLMTRPPLSVGVFTDGTIYGGTSLALTDIFEDHVFYLDALSISDLRSIFLGYINQKNRFQFLIRGFDYAIFYYPDYYYFYPELYYYATWQDALRVVEILGLDTFGIYPINRFYRIETSLGYYYYRDKFRYLDPYFENFFPFSLNGSLLSVSASIVGETTRFKYFGPIAGSTFKFTISQAIPLGSNFLSNTSLEADLRKYIKIGSETLFAFRLDAFSSTGKNPYLYYFGGDNQVRSVYYGTLIGNQGFFFNAEFRFPIFKNLPSIINLGPLRGTFFFDIASWKLKGYPYKFISTEDGIQLIDGIASYGWGLQIFLFGYPIHIDFVKPTDFKYTGSTRTRIWIGFDF